ncbi:MAG: polyphosphate polymerase domain-containing protein [Thermodesulfobacteriota bacterium]|nr:polyphosphate polymerase domain-containing protein [Thermodesulfobacteriota bacterium]
MQRGNEVGTSYLLERYESKFVIPYYMIEPISDFVSVYCSLDEYSKKAGCNFYRVNNLYFDSPDYLFLKKRLDGSDNRFNLRIRAYGDSSLLPYFLEIKQKKVNVVRKFRADVYDEEWHDIFLIPGYKTHKSRNYKKRSNMDLFFRLADSYNATPKVLTQYMRMAYISDVDGYARVTFDTDLRYQVEEGYNLIPDEDKMVANDNSTLFDPGCNVILELKCHTAQVPLWMIDLIRYFNLQKRSFSKYVTGVSDVLNLYKYDSSDRQTTAVSVIH